MSIPGRLSFNKFGDQGLFAAAIVALAFFAVSAALAQGTQQKFSSPDETANYLVTAQFASGKGLSIPSALTTAGGIVAPRSFASADRALLPGSFLGMPILYGSVARAVGVWIIPFLTPLFSAIALLAFFLLLRRFVRSEIAILATVLLMIHPAFWYFSSRGLYHNTLFLDLGLIGVYALLRACDLGRDTQPWKRALWYGGAGLLLGGSVAVRASEVVWLGIVILVLLIVNRKKLDFRFGFWMLVACAVLPMVLVFYYNSQLFGQPLSLGYSKKAISTASVGAFGAGVLSKVANLFFPFGIHLKTIALNVWDYGVRIFWMPALLSMFGLIQALRRKMSPAEWLYLAITLLVSAWLIAYYGSWVIQDSPNPNAVSIGTSYTRYWLPMYALAAPFAARFILYLADLAGRRRRLMLAGSVAVLAFGSVLLTVLDKDEGLAGARRSTIEYKRLADRVTVLTPPGSVIVAGTGDKIFFPERSVIVDARTPDQQFELRTLLTKVPVYVYVPPATSPITVVNEWRQRGFLLSNQINLARYERLFTVSDLRTTLSDTP